MVVYEISNLRMSVRFRLPAHYIFGPLVQWLEHMAYTHGVGGSNPSRATVFASIV